MNGAELLLRTAVENGIDLCLANAGTTEIPLVAALDGPLGIRCVLGLFEGVCTGAADGYGRVLDRPAMTLLHLGPGFANGIACLHNARRAGSPIVNVIGEHASWHRDADPPLNMDIAGLVRTVSGWYRTCRSPRSISRDMAEAIAASRVGRIASLIVPNDYQSADIEKVHRAKASPSFDVMDETALSKARTALRRGKQTALLLGGRALRREGLDIAERIRAATGCDLLAITFPGYMDRGASLPVVKRVPYFPEGALELMKNYETIVIAGAHEPVTFFGYPGIPSRVIPEKTRTIGLAGERHDVLAVLKALADTFGSKGSSHAARRDAVRKPAVPSGALTAETATATISAVQPENAIVVDEGITTTFPYYSISHGSAPHSLMTIAGGSIGYGMPASVGAALAAPDRPVLNIQADGSALYTVQALWTMAREGLNVTTLICSNRGYRIIGLELERAGLNDPGENVRRLVDIDRPDVDWVSLSRGLGVPAVRVEDAATLAKELKQAVAEAGPHLIEMVIKAG